MSAPQQAVPAAPSATAPEPEAGADINVSLSAAPREAASAPRAQPSLVYAEIWRDGVPVARIDIHGQVTSSQGFVATTGAGLAGPLLAAQRAVQVARQLGGEIRTAGQPVDGQTLLMRERLASAYAVA